MLAWQDLSKEKYGRVIVKKLFMYCTKPIKAEIIQEKVCPAPLRALHSLHDIHCTTFTVLHTAACAASRL